MAPLSPCALTRRPTRSCVLPGGGTGFAGLRASSPGPAMSSPATSVVRHVDAHAAAVGEGCDEGAQGFGRAAAAPDHATPVFGVDVHLEHVASRRRGRVDA